VAIQNAGEAPVKELAGACLRGLPCSPLRVCTDTGDAVECGPRQELPRGACSSSGWRPTPEFVDGEVDGTPSAPRQGTVCLRGVSAKRRDRWRSGSVLSREGCVVMGCLERVSPRNTEPGYPGRQQKYLRLD